VSAPAGSAIRAVSEYVLKVASRCDLACDHCYVYDDPQQAWLRQPPRMDPAVAQLAATRIADHSTSHGLSRVTVVLHGGEPLLLGEARLLPLLAVLRSTIEPVAELDLRLQSNGTLLTRRLCAGLVRHGVKVGVSLDGDRSANDRHRRYAFGGSSHRQVLRGLALLREPEFRSAYGGILCTIDVDNDPLHVYEALVREAPPRIDFLLPHATWDRPPPGRGYAEWLLKIYDRWEADGRPVPVRLFESVRSLEQGGASGSESLGVDNPTVAVIETDGTWELPDSLKTVSGDTPYTGLCVRDHSADDYLRHVAALRHPVHETPTACTTCPIVSTCGGGLFAHRFGRGNDFDNPSVFCADLARMIVGIRYRQQRASAPPMTPGNGTGPTAPDVLDGLIRHECEVDRELMFTVAVLAGRAHGRAAWQLLVDLEASRPELVVSTLSHPYVRRRIRDALAVARPEAAAVCRDLLVSVAITAAVDAGHPATFEVPVVDGAVCLPGLGVLTVPGASVVRVSSSTRPGEFEACPDGGESIALTVSGRTEAWRPVRYVDTGGPRLRFDDVDPARDCFGHPVAERLSSVEGEARIAALAQAWSSVRSVSPHLATILDKIITTVTPSAGPGTPLLAESPGDILGAVAIPSVEPHVLAVALVEHAARSIVSAADRAIGPVGDHLSVQTDQTLGQTFADVCALTASLRLAEGRKRHGQPVDDHWIAIRQDHLHVRLGELTRDDRMTALGRRLLDRLDDRGQTVDAGR
jgi:uncharacterized protein